MLVEGGAVRKWLTVVVAGVICCACASSPAHRAGPAAPRVLLVGTWHGRVGGFTSIQAAVNAARPGDWILIAPGDYHESPDAQTGVMIRTPDIHLRGLDRTRVVVDGTRPGAPKPCDSDARWQNLGTAFGGNLSGRNGIVVEGVDGVSIDNLTVCNFVGHDRTGIQLFFDGGYTTDEIGLGAFEANHITATSTSESADRARLASWGIFVSNTRGPGTVTNSFASNMADSAFHIGSCADCNTVFDHDTARHSVIGFTAINAGGRLRVEHSLFTDNAAGIDLASEQDLSSPPPQDGRCPGEQSTSRSTSPRSCTIVSNNRIVANNDPDVPGGANQGGTLTFIGAGIYVAGGRNDTITANTVTGQGSYGIVVVIYPWTGPPATAAARCQGGQNLVPGQLCLFNAYGNLIADNTLAGNGTFGNPTNGDLAEATITHTPGNCFVDNHEANDHAVTTAPAALQKPASACGTPSGGAIFGTLGVQIACATRALGPCTNGNPGSALGAVKALARALHGNLDQLDDPRLATMKAAYPSSVRPTAPPPPAQPSTSNPCAGVPGDPWC